MNDDSGAEAAAAAAAAEAGRSAEESRQRDIKQNACVESAFPLGLEDKAVELYNANQDVCRFVEEQRQANQAAEQATRDADNARQSAERAAQDANRISEGVTREAATQAAQDAAQAANAASENARMAQEHANSILLQSGIEAARTALEQARHAAELARDGSLRAAQFADNNFRFSMEDGSRQSVDSKCDSVKNVTVPGEHADKPSDAPPPLKPVLITAYGEKIFADDFGHTSQLLLPDPQNACFDACKMMTSSYGILEGKYGNVVVTQNRNRDRTLIKDENFKENAEKAIVYIDKQLLEKHRPVVVHVSPVGQDKDHFVVIYKKELNNLGEVVYKYKDPGTRNEEFKTGEFKVDKDSMLYKLPLSENPRYTCERRYEVFEVRRYIREME